MSMNIDRLPPKSIKESDAPMEDMLETLSDFADAIGGPAWRQRRTKSTGIERTIELYIDENHEFNDYEQRALFSDGEVETIEVAFTAERFMPDDDEEENSDFNNHYLLSYSSSFPLPDLSFIPEPYREQLAKEQQDDLDAILEKGQPDIIDEEAEPDAIVETNTVCYAINQHSGEITYNQSIEYSSGDVVIEGAKYTSDIEQSTSQDEYMDGCVIVEKSTDRSLSADTVTDHIITAHEIEDIVTKQENGMEVAGNTSEQHAMRIRAILSLVSNGIRSYRHNSIQ